MKTQKKPAAKVTMPAIADEMVDTIKAAAIIGIKPATLRMWRHEQREGQPSFAALPGGAIRYSTAHLNEWKQARTKTY